MAPFLFYAGYNGTPLARRGRSSWRAPKVAWGVTRGDCVLLDVLQSGAVAEERYVEDEQATSESLEGLDLGFWEFRGCEFRNCRLCGTKLAKASFYGCTFTACDLSGADLTSAFLKSCKLDGCKLEGANLGKAILRQTKLKDCACRYVACAESKWEGCTLDGCDLRESFFDGAKFQQRTKFQNCNLQKADLFRTKLAGMDLSACDIAGIALGPDRAEIRNAVIGIDQAADVAMLLGVKIRLD